ncbi:ASCH domain-containing protein [Massilia sp. PAMC28688]|uniref:ASCH domain-containing protein n=1 Tax=Massilia sp. PAMC28688 TaxID=2861283 RepID=UPI001C63A486|nr:ASCH domain-containing protein [Massilia sp. PAMC28688]QYF92664.1 ASCH domain-containing protein [Massilia sp. PAMC28688]
MWQRFVRSQDQATGSECAISSWHFCDNQHDADECARLVVAGAKRATAPSLWSLEHANEGPPQAGDLHVITNWAGIAQCIIRVTDVEIIAFDAVSEAHAREEGEGDGTLAWWRDAHWAYYHRELAGTGYHPRRDMPIMFTRFECVFPIPT